MGKHFKHFSSLPSAVSDMDNLSFEMRLSNSLQSQNKKKAPRIVVVNWDELDMIYAGIRLTITGSSASLFDHGSWWWFD